MSKTIAATVTFAGHTYEEQHSTNKREEVYFDVTADLPRVGEVKASFVADRYNVHQFNGPDDHTGHEAWSDWRTLRRPYPEMPPGVGPKALDLLHEAVVPQIEAWLASDAYRTSRRLAFARFIADEAKDRRYGDQRAQKLLQQYRNEISETSFKKLGMAMHLIAQGEAMLKVRDDEGDHD